MRKKTDISMIATDHSATLSGGGQHGSPDSKRTRKHTRGDPPARPAGQRVPGLAPARRAAADLRPRADGRPGSRVLAGQPAPGRHRGGPRLGRRSPHRRRGGDVPRADAGRARTRARRTALRPVQGHHPRAGPAVDKPVHQPDRGLHPDPEPGVGPGQGERRRRQPDRDRRRGRLAGARTPRRPPTRSTTTSSSSRSRPRPPSGTSRPATPTTAGARRTCCRCGRTPTRSPGSCRPS